MRRKILFLISLFVLFGLFVAGRFIYLKTQDTDGKLRVLSSPSAQVIIDDKKVGKTPFESDLKEGEYLIRLETTGKTKEATSWKGKIMINKNTLTFVDYELGTTDVSSTGIILSVSKMKTSPTISDDGEAEVVTEPKGAIVYLDNEEVGIAPLVLAGVASGDHELSVLNPGFFRRTQKVKIKPGFRIKAQFKLALDPTYKKVDVKTDTKDSKKTDGEKSSAESKPSAKKTVIVEIQETETGWLRVRKGPTTSSKEVGKVNPGDTFDLLEEDAGWYKIEYEKGKEGWISSRYADKKSTDKTDNQTTQEETE